MKESFYINRGFNDFEEFAEALRSWNILINQLQPGKPINHLRQLSTGNLQLAFASFAGQTYQIGDPPPGRTIALCADQNTELIWRKKEVSTNELMIFPTGSELDVVTRNTVNNLFTITMPDDMLGSRFRGGDRDVYDTMLAKHEMLRLPSQEIHKVRSLCQNYLQTIDHQPKLFRSQMFRSAMEEELLSTLSQAIFSSDNTLWKPVEKSVKQPWKKIEEILKTTLNKPIKVSELSQATGISERSLLRLFQKRFGLSPKTYLNRVRLCGVRHELKNSSGKVRISNVANNWGFWHMGQFAADYRKFFAELPSTTRGTVLKRNTLGSP